MIVFTKGDGIEFAGESNYSKVSLLTSVPLVPPAFN